MLKHASVGIVSLGSAKFHLRKSKRAVEFSIFAVKRVTVAEFEFGALTTPFVAGANKMAPRLGKMRRFRAIYFVCVCVPFFIRKSELSERSNF